MFDYLIYLIAFVVGSILGLLYSYKQHSEPFVAVSRYNKPAATISIIGWILAINTGNVILIAVGLLLSGFIMGERPGYGRKETATGLIIAVGIYLLRYSMM